MKYPFIARHRVARLMLEANLVARAKRRRAPSDIGTRAEHAIAANILDRDFTASAPNLKWVADFTYGTPSPRSPPAWG